MIGCHALHDSHPMRFRYAGPLSTPGANYLISSYHRRQQLCSKSIALHGLEEAARRMEAELRGHGLLPEGQSLVDGTAPLYYLTAPPPESAPPFSYSCLGQERYLQRYVPLPAAPAPSPPRHLGLAPGDSYL